MTNLEKLKVIIEKENGYYFLIVPILCEELNTTIYDLGNVDVSIERNQVMIIMIRMVGEILKCQAKEESFQYLEEYNNIFIHGFEGLESNNFSYFRNAIATHELIFNIEHGYKIN